MESRGLDNLLQDRPFILASNHVSMMDWSFICYYFPTLIRFVVHRQYYDHPVLGIGLRFNGAIPIRTERPDPAAIKYALDVLAHEPIVVFPEGGISPDGRPTRGHPGIIALASMARAPLIPVAIEGAHRVLPRDKRVPRPGPVRLHFGAALPPPPQGSRLEQKAMAQRLMQHIGQLLDGDSAPAPPW